jgi:hypothetical protein
MDMWKNIRLELGRTNEFPAGSVSRGYLLRLPLDPDGSVDRAALQRHPNRAKVRRYWSTEPDESGDVLPSEDNWSLRCDGKPPRMLDLGGKGIHIGDLVSVTEPDGTTFPFKIASVRDA